jgi:hypothetical protein
VLVLGPARVAEVLVEDDDRPLDEPTRQELEHRRGRAVEIGVEVDERQGFGVVGQPAGQRVLEEADDELGVRNHRRFVDRERAGVEVSAPRLGQPGERVDAEHGAGGLTSLGQACPRVGMTPSSSRVGVVCRGFRVG